MIKKAFWIFIIGSILVGFIFMISNNKEEGIRVRIVANSNLDVDINNKEIVKDALEEVLNEVNSLNVAEIKNKLDEKLDQSLSKMIKVELTKSSYEAKTYDGKFIPSGTFDTLLVTIGNGDGNNFWTLLYPEYYNIEFEESNEIEYKIYIVELIEKIKEYLTNLG